METPCTKEEVRLRYYPGDATLLDLPDFPQRSSMRDPVRWAEAGVVAAVLSVLLLVPVVVGVRLFRLILG
jgi:hypothetical protein